MKIRDESEFRDREGFSPEYTEAAIRELEDMRARGEIAPRAYLVKKQALVKLYLKSTTSPRRRSPWDAGDEFAEDDG